MFISIYSGNSWQIKLTTGYNLVKIHDIINKKIIICIKIQYIFYLI